jgi:acyl phosphate:glycerol-3-phosphate acyltransferase
MEIVLLVLLAYLLGSIPTGFLFGFFSGVDIREAGSGNVGATNVARVVGKKQGVVTLIVDVTKGFFPIFLSFQLGFDLTAGALVGLSAFLGHLYPIFLRFQGGKGVATGLGVFIGIDPVVAVVLLALFAMVVAGTRRVSVASMAAAGTAPVALWLLSYAPVVVVVGAIIGLMIVFRHRDNIRRLLSGTEPKFQF